MGFGILGGLLVGIPFLLLWFFKRRRGSASQSWPGVPGSVISSQLVESTDSEGDRTVSADVRYQYDVAGRTYQSSRVAFGSGGTAQSQVTKYRPGAPVTVYYDPEKPKSAVLEPGTAGVNVFLYIGLGLILVVGTIGLIQAWRERHGSPDAATEYREGVALYQNAKYAEAKTELETAARHGSTDAKVYLGVIYAKGQGVPTDMVEAQKWFLLAGDAGKKNADVLAEGLSKAQLAEAQNRATAWTAADAH